MPYSSKSIDYVSKELRFHPHEVVTRHLVISTRVVSEEASREPGLSFLSATKEAPQSLGISEDHMGILHFSVHMMETRCPFPPC